MHPLEDLLRARAVPAEDPRAVDRFAKVGDAACGCNVNLVAKELQRSRSARADRAFRNDLSLEPILTPGRRLLDPEDLPTDVHQECRVEEPTRGPPFDPSANGLEKPSVQLHAMSACAQGNPVELDKRPHPIAGVAAGSGSSSALAAGTPATS